MKKKDQISRRKTVNRKTALKVRSRSVKKVPVIAKATVLEKTAIIDMTPVVGLKPVTFCLKTDGAHNVYIAGSFNNWHPTQHEMTGLDGLFKITLQLTPGRHEYKFIVADNWTVDPKNPDHAVNQFGGLNSVIDVL